MSAHLGLLEDTPATSEPGRDLNPLRSLAILISIIFLAEVVSMVIIYFIPMPNYMIETMVDGLIMVVLIFPGLYLLQLRPLLNEISERLRTESILRTTDNLLSKILEQLPVGVWITNKNGKIIHGNPASVAIWGGAKFVGAEQYGEYKGWWLDSGRIIQPEEWAINRVIQQGETILDEEIEIESFEGDHKFILNSALPILDEVGAVQGAIIVNQDITQRLKYEEELVRKNELLEKYFLTIDTLIAYLDADFNFIRVNDTYAKIGGYPPEYFIGKNHFDLYPHPENEAIFKRVVETGEPYYAFEKPFEYPQFPERGVSYWDFSLHPVRGAKGQVEGLVLSLVDVTERKQAELQLERQNEELRELSIAERVNREFAENLAQATVALNASLEIDQVLEDILKHIRKTIPFQGAGVFLFEDQLLRMANYLGFEQFPAALPALEKIGSVNQYEFVHQVFSSSQPVLGNPKEGNHKWPSFSGLDWINSILAAPLMIGEKTIGMIGIVDERCDAYDQEDANRLKAFTGPAALAIRNAQLYNAESTAHRASEILRDAVQSLAQTLDINHVIATLIEYINLMVHSDLVGVTLLEDENRVETRVVKGYGPYAEKDDLQFFPSEETTNSVIQMIRSSNKSLILPANFTAQDTEPGYIHQWLVIPLMVSEKMIGLIEVGNAGESPFSPAQRRWIEALVGQAGVAIQNAWLFEQVRASSERLQSLARKMVEVQENERNHISRELHDEAGQVLSSLKLSLGRLEHDPACPEHIRIRLSELKNLTDTVLEELHRLAMDLRPATLDHLGLIAALTQLANKMDTDRLSIRFEAFGIEGRRFTPTLETIIYRIVQEALTNAIRYAQASDVSILLKMESEKMKVLIEDNGIGFNPEKVPPDGHIGLVGMRERAEMVGGKLIIESAPGIGTSVILEVPYDDTHSYRR